MATVSELVDHFAEKSGTRTEEGRVRARHLREAGLLPSTGRGRGGAHVTAQHCANYLAGWLATERAINAPEAVRMLARLKPDAMSGNLEDLNQQAKEALLDETFRKQKTFFRLFSPYFLPNLSFLECLAKLIEWGRTDPGWEVITDRLLDINCTRGWPYATIRFFGRTGCFIEQTYRLSDRNPDRIWFQTGVYQGHLHTCEAPLFISAVASKEVIVSLSDLLGAIDPIYKHIKDVDLELL